MPFACPAPKLELLDNKGFVLAKSHVLEELTSRGLTRKFKLLPFCSNLEFVALKAGFYGSHLPRWNHTDCRLCTLGLPAMKSLDLTVSL